MTQHRGQPLGPHDEFALFCVFDGHNGVLAAKYISETLLNRLVDKLPTGNPPDERDKEAFASWRQGIVRALAEVLSETHLSFAKLGQLAGCTVTIVLQVCGFLCECIYQHMSVCDTQTGWLVTCANLGDSRCVIDNGLETICLTDDHRVATNQQERRRVEHTGALIAPVCASGVNAGVLLLYMETNAHLITDHGHVCCCVAMETNAHFTNASSIGVGPAKDVNNGVGPLRIWPGGVCLSRGIGDFDLGDIIVPWPNVVQVLTMMVACSWSYIFSPLVGHHNMHVSQVDGYITACAMFTSRWLHHSMCHSHNQHLHRVPFSHLHHNTVFANHQP